jgi:PAS domain S-box-containing protein
MMNKHHSLRKFVILLSTLTIAAIAVVLFGGSSFAQKPASQMVSGQAGSSAQKSSKDALRPGASDLTLTEAERDWLRTHPVIRVMYDPAWAPIEFTDAQGNLTGITEDYLQLVEQRLGITFERVGGLSWQESISRLHNRDIDMTICLSATAERSKFLAFTNPYLNIPNVILARGAVTYIGDMRELTGHKVAVVDGYALVEWLSRDFPDIRLVKVKTVEEGLGLLQKREVSCFIDNLLVMNYYLAKLKTGNLKIAGTTPYEYAQCMAVRKDWAILTGILQKALDSITPADRAAIYRQWVPNRYETGFDYHLFWRVLAIFAVALVALIVWVQKLTGEVKQRKRAEEELAGANKLLQTILDTTPMRIFWKDVESHYLGCNLSFAREAGETQPEELIGKTDYQLIWPEQAERFQTDDRLVIDSGAPKLAYEEQIRSPDGELLNIRTSKVPLCNEQQEIIGVVGIYEDITERKLLKAQLVQAQKMEAIGQLAGGVAHDFNNKLGVILGYAELVLKQSAPEQPHFQHLQEIYKAAESSAALTRQLLAFARQQPVTPKVLDLNENIYGMLQMLRRLIGEDIELAWLPGTGLWPIKVDPTQMDQLLANLSINARDAISGGGRLSIATTNITVGPEDRASHPYCQPGDYVSLTVNDDGCGMDEATKNKIFEPFFTTKEVGKGTGLGLSTVFGIVKQNQGVINVYSKPGRGTSFRIYLPRHKGEAEPLQTASPAIETVKGNGSILVVDDDPSIRDIVTMMLETSGYRVIEATSPAEALELTDKHSREIRLLITDVIMPEMNGRDLAKQIESVHPDLKCLFMSGYTDTVIAHHGVLDESVLFIQKPFSMAELNDKVQRALGFP